VLVTSKSLRRTLLIFSVVRAAAYAVPRSKLRSSAV
jgi:hypothetical protein